MKIGPPIAMVAALGLSVWIVLGIQSPKIPPTPGSSQFELLINRKKVHVECIRPTSEESGAQQTYRFLSGPDAGKQVSEVGFRDFINTQATPGGRDWVLRVLNVSSFGQLLWVVVGLGGQLLFSGRMIVQWVTSEKKQQSVVPPMFWYMSMGGGLFLAAYFIWRQDLVGVLGQSSGLVIYARNIRLLFKQKRREASVDTGSAAKSR